MRPRIAVLIIALLPTVAVAQQSLPVSPAHERIIVVVPMVGAGTYADMKRPLFAPAKVGTDGIISFRWQPSDDGRHAILELVARDRSAFAALAADARVLKAFEKGKADQDTIERELRKFKKDFSLTKFAGGAQ